MVEMALHTNYFDNNSTEVFNYPLLGSLKYRPVEILYSSYLFPKLFLCQFHEILMTGSQGKGIQSPIARRWSNLPRRCLIELVARWFWEGWEHYHSLEEKTVMYLI